MAAVKRQIIALQAVGNSSGDALNLKWDMRVIASRINALLARLFKVDPEQLFISNRFRAEVEARNARIAFYKHHVH